MYENPVAILNKNQNVGKSLIYMSFRDFRVVITFVKKYDRFFVSELSCRGTYHC